jgi:hypothetical protein
MQMNQILIDHVDLKSTSVPNGRTHFGTKGRLRQGVKSTMPYMHRSTVSSQHNFDFDCLSHSSTVLAEQEQIILHQSGCGSRRPTLP